jgi:hypothetical protein
MEIDGHCYVHNVTKVEVEKVRGKYSDFVRIRIKGGASETNDVLSFACWGVRPVGREFDPPIQAEVTITEIDEREPADAIDASDESDR